MSIPTMVHTDERLSGSAGSVAIAFQPRAPGQCRVDGDGDGDGEPKNRPRRPNEKAAPANTKRLAPAYRPELSNSSRADFSDFLATFMAVLNSPCVD